MKLFLFFILAYSPTSCAGQKTMNIYIAHCDSMYYAEGSTFEPKKLKGGKMTDSTFTKEFFNNMSPAEYKIAFKPYMDICTEDGIGPFLESWKVFFASKGFSNEIPPTDDVEDDYFGEMSVYRFITRAPSGKSDIGSPVPPPPPPPPPPSIVVTEDGNPIPGSVEDAFYVKAKNVVTFLLSADIVYYYEGIFKGTLLKTDYSSAGKLIQQYKKKIPAEGLMFIIKSAPEASFKNAIDILDEMTINKVPPGHYAETEITKEEIESINILKKTKNG